MSIPSSPEVEAAVKCIDDRVCEWTVTDTQRPETVESVEQKDALLALRSAQHAASTAPLLAEVEKLKLDLEGTRNDYGSVYAAMCKAQDEGRRLREALREVVRLCESAGVRNLANGVELGAMSWLMKMTDAIAEARKALGGSK